MKTIYKKGFTLIELLVVISIISLLSSVVLASVKTGREKAILTKTVAEMKSLQQAVELYKNQFGVYPGEGDNLMYSDPWESSTTWGGNTNSLLNFQNTYFVSTKLLVSPVLAPTFEACDGGCYNKGYSLLYTANKIIFGGVFSCGGIPINNYIIFLTANSKKINLPEATINFGSGDVNAGSFNLLGYPPYTYCLSG